MIKIAARTLASLAIVGITIATLVTGGQAQALSGSDFQPGRIIDDGVFYDANSMTLTDIQNFLNSQVPSCDNAGNLPYYGTYGGVTYNGNVARKNLDSHYPAPYTCLRDYYENTSTHDNNIGNPSYRPAGGISAAQIIYNAAHDYNISPKVLIVLVQKESGLITDSWPWSWEYRSAAGYGCPDTAACDSTYYGFYNQVHNAARQFRIYANNPTSYNYTIGTNQILYSPTTSCGRQTVNIQNMATLSLYIYTPYVPNTAALNNLYGSGDSCSSYGNRNFWRQYNDWFGSTYTPSYGSQYVSETTSSATLVQGQSTQISITYKNIGSNAWYDDTTAAAASASPVHLATSHNLNRSSVFGGTWGGDHNRATSVFSAVTQTNGTVYGSNPHKVNPGESATFTFTLSSSTSTPTGAYNEFFQPIVEGGSTMNDPWTFITMNVQAQTYSSSFAGQSAYPTFMQTQSAAVWLKYKNTGNMPWYDDTTAAANSANPVHLSTAHGLNRASQFGASWNSDKNRPAATFAAVYEADGVTLAANQHVAQPGQIVKFAFSMTAPVASTTAGTYDEFFQPIVEGGPTMNDPWTFLTTTLQPITMSSQWVSQSAYPVMNSGTSTTGSFNFKNTGNVAWYDDSSVGSSTYGAYAVHLVTSHVLGRHSVLGSTWNNGNRAALTFSAVYEADGTTLAANQHVAQPGQIVAFTIPFTSTIDTPGGSYNEFFILAAENTAAAPIVMNDQGTSLNVTVNKPVMKTQWISQSAYPTINRGSSSPAFFEFKNVGNVAWYDDSSVGSSPYGNYPVHFSTAAYVNRASIFGSTWNANKNRPNLTFSNVYESDGVTLAANQHVAQPGQIVKFAFTLSAPSNAAVGTYREYFIPMVEGSYDGLINDVGASLDVTVR